MFKLIDFDFSGGSRFVFSNKYNLLDESCVTELEGDSAKAATLVKQFGLSYDINARHYSTISPHENTIIDMAEVIWTFWKVDE